MQKERGKLSSLARLCGPREMFAPCYSFRIVFTITRTAFAEGLNTLATYAV